LKYASQTATEQEDYHWNADSNDFCSVADNEWSLWHVENVEGVWFGVISRSGNVFFLAGNVPTGRFDKARRKIKSFIVLQPETDEDKRQIINLAANLLTRKNEAKFYSWADRLALVQENRMQIPGLSVEKQNFPKTGTLIGQYEYPLNEEYDDFRSDIASSLGYLFQSSRDFVVALINYPASTFYKRVCGNLKNAEIAVFSKCTESKKRFSSLKPKESLIQKVRKMSILKDAGFLIIIVVMFCCFRYQVNQLCSQIQDLQSNSSDIVLKADASSQRIETLEKISKNHTGQIADISQKIQQIKLQPLPAPEESDSQK